MQLNKVARPASISDFFVSVYRRIGVGGMQQVALVFICLLLAFFMQMNYPKYLSPVNREVMLVNYVTEAIMALGMTIVMITGGIDISVAGVLQFSAVVVGLLLNAGWPIPLAIAGALIASALIGLINAAATITFKVHPFIVTMATLLTLRGVDLVITKGGTVSGFPDAFGFIGQTTFLGVRVSIILFIILALIIGFALKNHRYLQNAYFIGGNRRAARMSGVRVERFMVFAFMLNSLLAGIAGVVICSQLSAASVSFGQNAELRVITAVAIGGASFSGGSGTILGTTLGVIFLAMIANAFNMTGINTYWYDVVTGVMLLLAVFLGEYLKRRKTSR
jgi:ribose/xylose/arabinose/galactoside ABC-type transport system permease subunit